LHRTGARLSGESVASQSIVVTEEYPGKERIPDVCDAQKIEHCGVADLIEKKDGLAKTATPVMPPRRDASSVPNSSAVACWSRPVSSLSFMISTSQRTLPYCLLRLYAAPLSDPKVKAAYLGSD
jgi:hypothetical protein